MIPASTAPVLWNDVKREKIFEAWITRLAKEHGLLPARISLASADASFRRYLRVAKNNGDSCIIMDSPPALENNSTFVCIAHKLRQAGLKVPEILAWDHANGFLLLSDLGSQTLLQGMDTTAFAPNAKHYQEANNILVQLQTTTEHTGPHTLPDYNAALLLRELQLFPEWYIQSYLQVRLPPKDLSDLGALFKHIVTQNLAAPKVFVHRDFMPRNLILPYPNDVGLGLLDFQDAVYGPITYDIASLMRDAFHSWDEEHVVDVTVRYWEKARKLGLMDFEDWHRDFGAFWRAVDWMALQRHLKVAGVFARLGLRDHKHKYLADTPRFIHYIRNTCARYRTLTPLLHLLDRIEGAAPTEVVSFGRMT